MDRPETQIFSFVLFRAFSTTKLTEWSDRGRKEALVDGQHQRLAGSRKQCVSSVQRTAGCEDIVDQQQFSFRNGNDGDQANVGGSLLPLEDVSLMHVILRFFQQLHDRQPQS